MKKVRTIIGMLLSMAMLSGCAASKNQNLVSQEVESSNEPISLTIWVGEREEEISNEMITSFKEAYKDEATFDITIELADEGVCKERIFADVNSAPDLFSFADDQLIELAAAGVVEAVSDAEWIKDENSEGAVEAVTLNEKIYAYPMTADNGYFMFYNKQYFSEKDLETLDGILAVASSLGKKVTMDWTSGWYLYSFFGNTGLNLSLNKDGITNDCDWNSTTNAIKGIDVGNAMSEIARNPGFMNGNDEALLNGAKDGSVIAGVSGVWCAGELQETWGDNFAAIKLPTYTCAGKQIQMASYAGYKMIGVNSYSNEKEWASKLAEWMTNETNQQLRFEKRGIGPSNSKAASSEEVSNSPAIQALVKQSEYASLQRIGPKYWNPVAAFAEQILNGSAVASNMQKVMDEMVADITAKVTDR